MLSFFPQAVLDEILNLIESVSERFPTYSYNDRKKETNFDRRKYFKAHCETLMSDKIVKTFLLEIIDQLLCDIYT